MADKNISVRIPGELHAQIKEAAEQDRRSMNSEILALIEEALKKRSKA